MSKRYNKRTRARQRMGSPAPVKGTDSLPASFVGAALGDDVQDKWLSNQPVLEWLDVQTAVACMAETLRGAYARTQWTYELLEQSDALLAACVKRRRAALSNVPWDIRLKDDVPDELSNLADRQLAVVQDFYNGLAGLKRSILALGSAEFRGYKILQKTVNARGDLCLEETDNWNWVRDGYRGVWGWNPRGQFGLTSGDAVPVDRSSLIIRTCSLPIDHVAIFIVLGAKNTMAQWRVYNGTYGVPVIMLYMPDGISPEDREKFIEVGRRITSSGKGVLPAGSKADILACTANSFDSFDRLLTREDRNLILATTGGQLTMLAESGSGTLAGGAHQTAFDQLAAMEAAEIADILNDDLTTDILDEYFPGDDHLVRLAMEQQDKDGGQKSIADIVSLSGAGYRVSPETVQEKTGYEVQEGANPAQGMAASGQYPPVMLNMSSGQSVATRSDQVPSQDQLDPDLTEEELDALRQATAPPSQEELVAMADAMVPILEEAAGILQMPAEMPGEAETGHQPEK